ncbi:MAG: beta-phosphoglucomutase [Bacteroidota bacterium]
MTKIKACIFDLDGVIVDTAKYHFAAWRRLANSLGFDFTEKENEKLKGVSRIQSLKLILTWGGITKSDEEIQELASIKNEWYLEYVRKMDEREILPGVIRLLDELKAQHIRIALGSASKNAPTILNQIGLAHYFEAIIDGNSVQKSKPDPEVFLLGAKALDCDPVHCVVFEDAAKGVQAAKAANMLAIGVGTPESLPLADHVIPGFEHFSLTNLQEIATSVV